MHISSIEEILKDFKSGHFVILVDDKERENEGDLILAAEFIDAAKINFMSKEARGLIYLAMQPKQIERLKLPMLESDLHKSNLNHAAFTYSIEASHGITTGISAKDRAHTIRVAINPTATHLDISCPGHVFPLKAKAGGVLERAGHTEAGVDLAVLCNLNASAVACEIMDEEGDAAKGADLQKFADRFRIKIGTVEDLINYRKSAQKNL